jgi:hypothetical protein
LFRRCCTDKFIIILLILCVIFNWMSSSSRTMKHLRWLLLVWNCTTLREIIITIIIIIILCLYFIKTIVVPVGRRSAYPGRPRSYMKTLYVLSAMPMGTINSTRPTAIGEHRSASMCHTPNVRRHRSCTRT